MDSCHLDLGGSWFFLQIYIILWGMVYHIYLHPSIFKAGKSHMIPNTPMALSDDTVPRPPRTRAPNKWQRPSRRGPWPRVTWTDLAVQDLWAKFSWSLCKCIGYIGDKYIIHGFYGYVGEFCFKGIILQDETVIVFCRFLFLGAGKRIVPTP